MEKHTCKTCGREYEGSKIDTCFKNGYGMCRSCANLKIEREGKLINFSKFAEKRKAGDEPIIY